jgi:hypothetical protein
MREISNGDAEKNSGNYAFAAQCPFCSGIVSGFIAPHSIDARTRTTKTAVIHRCEHCQSILGMRGTVVGSHIRVTETGDGAKMTALDIEALLAGHPVRANVRPPFWVRVAATMRRRQSARSKRNTTGGSHQ